MNSGSPSNEKIRNASAIVANIWQRARINAFAHRLAYERCRRFASVFFVMELFAALLSIIAIVLLYLLTSTDGHVAEIFSSDPSKAEVFKAKLALILTVSSIGLTFTALFLGLMTNYFKWDVVGAEHKFYVGSYQYIAQRAREAKWPDKPYEEIVGLLKDLERDFQLMKARGTEPTDDIFEKANAVFDKIGRNSVANSAQSFRGESPVDEGGPSGSA